MFCSTTFWLVSALPQLTDLQFSLLFWSTVLQVYRRLVTAVNDVEKRIPFSHDDRLGFLTFCPTNLGTTVRASVHIKVPKLASDKAKLEEVAGKYNLQVSVISPALWTGLLCNCTWRACE
jgi:protein-arginine kinase